MPNLPRKTLTNTFPGEAVFNGHGFSMPRFTTQLLPQDFAHLVSRSTDGQQDTVAVDKESASTGVSYTV